MQMFSQCCVNFAAPAESAINNFGEQSPVTLIHATILERSIEQNVGIGFARVDLGENLSRDCA
jgi:hypothetical protein